MVVIIKKKNNNVEGKTSTALFNRGYASRSKRKRWHQLVRLEVALDTTSSRTVMTVECISGHETV